MLLSLKEQSPIFHPSQVLVDKLNSILIGLESDKFEDIEENNVDIDNNDLIDAFEEFDDNGNDKIQDYTGKFFESENQDPVIIKIKKPPDVKKSQLSLSDRYPGGSCGVCGKLILPVRRLLDHLKSAHDVEHKCSKCDKRFSSEKKLKVHLFHRHKFGDYRPQGTLPCKHQCGKSFTKSGLINHEPNCIQKDIPCELCGKMVLQSKMYSHLRCHRDKPLIKCKLCGKDVRYLKEHERRVHGEEKILLPKKVCSVCGKYFTNISGHMRRVHGHIDGTGNELLHCDVCGYKTPSKNELSRHKEHHDATPQPCEQCGVMVKHMRLHIETVHTPDDQRKYQCQDCGKGFSAPSYLEKHRMSVHLKLYPYVCRYPDCEAKYNDRDNRNCHEKKKHGARFDKVK